MTIGIKRKLWIGFLSLNVLFILFFWFKGSIEVFDDGLPGALVALGRLSGLFAALFVLMQFFLMGRNPLIERVFGLDKLSLVHHRSGQLSFFFLILHPFSLVLGYKSYTGLSFFDQYTFLIKNSDDVLLAAISLLMLIVVIGSSIAISRMRLKYEYWYFTHLLVYLAVFLSFFHQIELGTTLNTSTVFYSYWILLYAGVFLSHILFRFGRPVWNYRKHKFYVSLIKQETHDTVSLYIKGNNLEQFKVEPGQFMIFRFLNNTWWQAHPFSLSKIPDDSLRITVKNVGDFTSKISQIKVGTKVLIDGPYGIFTDFFSASKSVLFIAGGIGITPIRSLMEQMLRKGKNAALLYANKTSRDIVFANELDSLFKQYRLSINHIFSNEDNPIGESGYVDAEKIKRLVPDYLDREVFLCGPPKMMEVVLKELRSIGINRDKIHFEKFSLG
jgi:predicted ferric reductase